MPTTITVFVIAAAPYVGAVEEVLSRAGYLVMSASTKEEVWAQLDAQQPDLILADLGVAGIIPLLEELERADRTKNLIFLFDARRIAEEAASGSANRERRAALLRLLTHTQDRTRAIAG